jgi:multidrug efflux pump subunit AcrA (membrane-fusion protein)
VAHTEENQGNQEEGALHKHFMLLGVVIVCVAAGVDGPTFVGAQVLRQIHVIFSLPADSIPQIRARLQDGSIEVTARDSNGWSLGIGKLTLIDNHINPASGTLRFMATFDNTIDGLRSGQSVNVGVLGYRAIGEVVP